MRKPQKPSPTTLHLKLDPELERDLDQIVAWMKSDPLLGRLRADLGREKALRYAVVRCLQNPPAHLESQG